MSTILWIVLAAIGGWFVLMLLAGTSPLATKPRTPMTWQRFITATLGYTAIWVALIYFLAP